MGADDTMRSFVGALPPPGLEPVATTAPPLDRARVALVTTAGITSGGAKLWSLTDASFTQFHAEDPDLRLSHFSPNFDRAGYAADRNVVLPLDRLAELVEDGTIGTLNHRHLAFMGAQFELSTILSDTGPAAAQLLLGDGVDVVLLTPV